MADEPHQRAYPAQTGDRRHHVALAKIAPDLQCGGRLLAGVEVGQRRQRGGVDRSHAGPAPDLHPLTAGLEGGQQDRERPDLVRAAGAAARQHDRDLGGGAGNAAVARQRHSRILAAVRRR
jgi:hypothetical protein